MPYRHRFFINTHWHFSFISGGRLLIRLGDKEVEYSPEFRFYITTKLSNPHYTPEISTKTTIVNFAVKEQGDTFDSSVNVEWFVLGSLLVMRGQIMMTSQQCSFLWHSNLSCSCAGFLMLCLVIERYTFLSQPIRRTQQTIHVTGLFVLSRAWRWLCFAFFADWFIFSFHCLLWLTT